MSESLALLVFVAIMGTGSIVWLWSLVKALRIGGDEKRDAEAVGRGFATPGTKPEAEVERRECTIHGDPEQISRALVRALLQGHAGMFGSLFEVVERTARRVVVKKTGPLVLNQPAGLFFSEAEFELEPMGGDAVRVRYSLGFARLARRMRRIALAIILGVGLPVMALVGILAWIFVIPAETDGVRWQILQCLHIGHALWPPFLFIYLYSMGRRHSQTFVSNLLTTLEYAD